MFFPPGSSSCHSPSLALPSIFENLTLVPLPAVSPYCRGSASSPLIPFLVNHSYHIPATAGGSTPACFHSYRVAKASSSHSHFFPTGALYLSSCIKPLAPVSSLVPIFPSLAKPFPVPVAQTPYPGTSCFRPPLLLITDRVLRPSVALNYLSRYLFVLVPAPVTRPPCSGIS